MPIKPCPSLTPNQTPLHFNQIKIPPKLILIDCDGVLYHPNELDINAMVYAYNIVCDHLGLTEDKFDCIENCTYNKKIKGLFNYINYVATRENIGMENFISLMIQQVDYSHIQPDNTGLLEKLEKLNSKVQLCIYTNNHLSHLDHVLKAKLNIESKDLPFPCFDIRFSVKNGMFHHKEAPISLQKLEKFFHIPIRDFVWIDDNPAILKTVQESDCQGLLITQEFSLSDALDKICVK